MDAIELLLVRGGSGTETLLLKLVFDVLGLCEACDDVSVCLKAGQGVRVRVTLSRRARTRRAVGTCRELGRTASAHGGRGTGWGGTLGKESKEKPGEAIAEGGGLYREHIGSPVCLSIWCTHWTGHHWLPAIA